MAIKEILDQIGAHLIREQKPNNFFPKGNPVSSSNPALVLVHPFYFGLDENLKEYYQHSQLSQGHRYVANLRVALANPDRNIVLFETEHYSRSTLELLSLMRPLDGVYLVQTEPRTSYPINAGFMPWKYIAEKMSTISDEFEFAGGELYGDISDTRGLEGCLGGAFRHLNFLGIKDRFKEGCCFSAASQVGWNF